MSCPWSFGHWSINLLQVELTLDGLLVDIRDHVRGLHERHRERRPHHDTEAPLCLWDGKIHLEWLKILTESALCVKGLKDDCALAVFLERLEVFEVNGEILVVLVGLAELLMNHGAQQVELLDALCLFSICRALGQFLVDFLECSSPISCLNQVNDHVVVVLPHIQRAEANVGQIALLALLTRHGHRRD